MGSVNTEFLLFAAGALHPPRAASLRRLLAFLRRSAPAARSPGALAEIARRWLALEPLDDLAAAQRLVAADLLDLLARLEVVAPRIAGWSEPGRALMDAVDRLTAQLGSWGVELERPAVDLVERMPEPYDHPALDVVSLDASDAASLGRRPGLLLRTRRLLPFAAELAIGHALVHHALGARSPERLGRGFEEGVAEVLGGVLAAGEVLGTDAIDGVFRALRYTASVRTERETFLDAARCAGLLAGDAGPAPLVELLRGGRDAVKRAEAELFRGRLVPPGVAVPGSRLARLLGARLRPLVLRPLAFLLAPALAARGSVEAAAADCGVPVPVALAAARELHGGVFAAVLDGAGRVLVHDIDLLLAAGGFRYDLPPPAA